MSFIKTDSSPKESGEFWTISPCASSATLQSVSAGDMYIAGIHDARTQRVVTIGPESGKLFGSASAGFVKALLFQDGWAPMMVSDRRLPRHFEKENGRRSNIRLRV